MTFLYGNNQMFRISLIRKIILLNSCSMLYLNGIGAIIEFELLASSSLHWEKKKEICHENENIAKEIGAVFCNDSTNDVFRFIDRPSASCKLVRPSKRRFRLRHELDGGVERV